MIYEEIFREFEFRNVKYLIVGGIAVNLYGYIRLTMDLDIMVDLSDENLSKLIEIMDKFNYTPRAPIKSDEILFDEKRDKWIKEKRAVVFTFINLKKPYKCIDIFLKNPVDFEMAYSHKTVMSVRDIKIKVASVEDIIKMKRVLGRPRDIEDIGHLEKIKLIKNRENK